MENENNEKEKIKVLVVDDEFIVATDIKYTLEKSGVTVTGIAMTAEDALSKVKTDEPDLILMDIMLKSGIDGITLAEQISEIAEIPIIFLTAYSDNKTIERAKRVGPFGYLIKPFNSHELTIAIETSLNKHVLNKKLKESQEKFESIFKLSPNPVVIIDISLQVFVEVNDKFCDVSGYSRAELIGRRTDEINFWINEEDRKHWYSEFYPSETFENREFKFRSKDGKTIHTLVSAKLIELNKKKYLLAVVNDVTEIKQAQLELATSQNRLSNLISNLQGIVYRCRNDKDWSMEFISAGVKDLTGYSADSIINNSEISYAEIIHPEDRDRIWTEVQNGIKRRDHFELQYRIITKNGDVKWVWEKGLATYNTNGDVESLEGFITDISEQKRAEYELIQRENKLQSIFRVAPIGIGVIVENVFMQINEEISKMTGYSHQELIGQNLRKLLISESEYTLIDKLIKRQISEIGSSSLETKWKRKDGLYIDVLLSSTPINMNNLLEGITITALDITERKHVLNLVLESEEHFRTLVENSPVPTFIQASNNFVYFNNAALIAFGMNDPDQLLNKPIGKIVHPDFTEFVNDRTYKQNIFKDRIPAADEKFLKLDGTIMDVRVSSVPYTYKGINGTLVSFIDMTERIQAERALKESEEKFRNFFEQDLSGDYISTVEGNLIDCNEAFCKIFGFSSKEEAKNYSLLNLYPNALDRKKYLNKIKRHKMIENNNSSFLSKDGRLIHAIERCQGIFDENGKLYRIMGYVFDITERVEAEKKVSMYRDHLESLVASRTTELDIANKKLQKEIQKEKEFEMMLKESLAREKELNELKSRFISTTSHEFRTPLTSIFSSTELIERYGKRWSEEKKAEHFNRIKNSVQFLTRLLDDVLVISRSEAGKILVEAQTTDLNILCNEVVKETKSYSTKNHKLILQIHLKRKKYTTDIKLFRFILLNLISNAYKYSPKGGEIKISLSENNSSVVVKVADEGIGIHDEDKQYLFEPFQRGRNSSDISGTGLGLSIVKRAVELLNGEIKFNSILNKGSEFIIKLPKNPRLKNE